VTDKESTSLYLRVDHLAWADESNVNLSGVVNQSLEQYRTGKSHAAVAVSEYRLRELQKKQKAKEAELEAIQEEL